MSRLDACLIRIPIESHEPALLAPETSLLRRVRRDVTELMCVFDAGSSADHWIDFWSAWSRHRQAWRFARESAWKRTVERGAIGLLDPDITAERAVALLVEQQDAHASLFTGGLWWGASQACAWSGQLQLEASEDIGGSLASYLAFVVERESGIHRQLTAYARAAVLEITGDLGRARHAAFDSVEWRGELAGGPPFLLTARLEPETPSQMDDPCKANAVAAAPDCWDVAARLRIGNY